MCAPYGVPRSYAKINWRVQIMTHKTTQHDLSKAHEEAKMMKAQAGYRTNKRHAGHVSRIGVFMREKYIDPRISYLPVQSDVVFFALKLMGEDGCLVCPQPFVMPNPTPNPAESSSSASCLDALECVKLI